MPHTISRRTYKAIAFIASSFIFSHIWLAFDGDNKKINPFPLYKDYQLSTHWYVYFLGTALSQISLAGAFLLVSRMNQLLKVAATVFFIYSIIDLILFILCNNTVSYVIVGGLLMLSIVVVSYAEFGEAKTGSREMPSVRKKKIQIEHIEKKLNH